MTLMRRACSVVLACAFAVAGLAGCSSGPGWVCACPAAPKPAYAIDVTMAGRVRWRVPLSPPGSGVQALAVGDVAVFAQSDVLLRRRAGEFPGSRLYGLRLADGHRLWSWTFGQGIAGIWRWQNLVVVLTQIGRSGRPLPVLTGLDASTGRARWTLPMGGDVGSSSPTADGGLPVEVNRGDGVLEVVDVSSGRVRWTRPVDGADLVTAGGGVVVFNASNSQLTSYDDRTGQVRWTLPLTSIALDPTGMHASGLVYLTGEVLQSAGGPTQMLLGISAADGRVKWRFTCSPVGSLDPHAPGLVSVRANSGRTSQDELDPATGRVRWHVISPYSAVATPAGIVTASRRKRISMRDPLTGQTRWTARLKGGWLPLIADPGTVSQPPPVLRAGRLLVVPAAGPDGLDLLAAFRMSDGHRAWQVTTGPIAAPLWAVPGGILVYTV